MKSTVVATAIGGAAAVLAAGVVWAAPSASAGSDFCNTLPNPAQVRECNCGFDNIPGSQEYRDCLHGNAVAPAPASTPAPAQPAPVPPG